MSHPQPFNHVVLVGTGLLGASLGLALRKTALAKTLTGVGRAASSSLAIARERGAIDHASTDLATAVRGNAAAPPADLVVLCTPIRQFPDALRILAGALSPGTLITDVGSTKTQVMQWAAELLPASAHFVGSHPMAGSEKSGPEAARDNLYQNAVCLLCAPLPPASPLPFERIRQMWIALGMRTITLDPAQHDRWVATISHLPHAVAYTLVNAASRDPAMLEAVAGGFLDTTRVASSDIAMWTDIFLTNRQAVLAAIELFTGELMSLRTAIANADEKTIRGLLSRGKQSRDALLAHRKASGLNVKSDECPKEKR